VSDLDFPRYIRPREDTDMAQRRYESNCFPVSMQDLLHEPFILCHEGHVLDALAIYDRIAESIAPGPVHFGQAQSKEIQ